RDFLPGLVSRLDQFHHYDALATDEGNVADANAADLLGMVHGGLRLTVRVSGLVRSGAAALPGPQLRDEFLQALRTGRIGAADRRRRRLAAAVATPVLVLRSPGGLSGDHSCDGSHLARHGDLCAKAGVRLSHDGGGDPGDWRARISDLGTSHV